MVLGGVVDDEQVADLQAIAQLQKDVEGKQDAYNAQMRNKLSLDMSVQQIKSMKTGHNTNKEVEEMKKELGEIRKIQDKETMAALLALVRARTKFEKDYIKMMKARTRTKITMQVESPMKFKESSVETLPIGTESLQMDVQYFRCEKGKQGSMAHVKKVSEHTASASTSRRWYGHGGGGNSVGSDTEEHMNRQTESNDVVGTLVITARATHKKAKFYDAKYDSTKLLRAWNQKVKGETIDLPANVNEVFNEWTEKKDILADDEEEWANDKSIAVLTGQTYGSTFIGFIHFLKSKKTNSIQEVRKNAKTTARATSSALWWASYSGSFGLDKATSDEIKCLMSSASISSHVCVQTYGLIPSIASQGMDTSIKRFSSFDPKATDEKLSLLNSKKDTNGGFDARKQQAVRAGQISGSERAKIGAVLTGIQDGDKSNNQVLNMNSMMLAFDDYVKNVREAEGGVPLTFFVSRLRKADVIGHWMQEFRPDLWERGINGRKLHDDDESDDSDDEQDGKAKKR